MPTHSLEPFLLFKSPSANGFAGFECAIGNGDLVGAFKYGGSHTDGFAYAIIVPYFRWVGR